MIIVPLIKWDMLYDSMIQL